MSGCTNFQPNLWKPQLCSNCLQPHSFASAPPSPVLISGRIVGRTISPPTIIHHPPTLKPIPTLTTPTTPTLKPSLASSTPSHPPTHNKQQPLYTTHNSSHTHKRSHSTPTGSSSSVTTSSGSNKKHQPTFKAPIHVLTHSESAKRKKGGATSACDSFLPQRWRPSICMHCFEPITLHSNDPFTRGENYLNSLSHMDIASPPTDDGNGEDDTTTIATQIPLPETPRVQLPQQQQQDMDETLLKLTSLTFTPASPGNRTPPLTPVQVPSTPRNLSSSFTQRLTPRPSTAPSPTRVFDEDDPFRDFEDLTDTTLDFKTIASLQGFDITTADGSVTAPFGPLRTLRSSRGREQFFDKYKDNEDDWEGGVDMDVEHFVALADYSYVNNKIMEIASVKEEAERSQANFQDNPTVVAALFEILTAKQQQIQKALAREKINAQDHSKLLERLNAVKDMLKPNQSATW